MSEEVSVRETAVGAFGHRTRSRRVLPLFAFSAAVATVFVLAAAPHQTAFAETAAVDYSPGKAQSLAVSKNVTVTAVRDSYAVTRRSVLIVRAAVAAPAVGVPDPGTAQEIGLELVTARGWGSDQYACLVSLFNKESGWRVNAANPSGAYGIPQALPGAKMVSAGADWQTNPRTQITWGLNYIQARYLTPCGAWGHSQSSGWY